MSADVLTIDVSVAETGLEIFGALSEITPEKSLSFMLTEDGAEAVKLAITLSEWGIGGNKSKLKETALEILSQIDRVEAGDPVNVNLTEYEVKSMAEVHEAIEKALEQQEDGVLEI